MFFSNSIIQISTFSAISTLFWYSVYIKFRQLYQWEEEFCARVVAAIHAVIVVILSFISIKYGADPIYSPGKDNLTEFLFFRNVY